MFQFFEMLGFVIVQFTIAFPYSVAFFPIYVDTPAELENFQLQDAKHENWKLLFWRKMKDSPFEKWRTVLSRDASAT